MAHVTRGIRAAAAAALVVGGLHAIAIAPAASAPVAAEPCTIIGTDGDDVLRGTAGDDVICALGGDDKVRALSGDDVIRGGRGDDLLRGGPGDDLVAGGGGDDRIFGQGGDDVVRGDAGDDQITGGPGSDRMGGFKGADTLRGIGDPGSRDDMRCGPGPDSASGDPDDRVRSDCETRIQNDPPTDITLTPSSIPEQAAVGTEIGALDAVDPDPGEVVTFALVPGSGAADNDKVDIDGDALESAEVYDFETQAALSVRVRATDAAGEFVEKALVVAVTDANDVPVAVDDDATTTEDTTLDLPVSGPGSPAANDTDQDGDSLSVTAATNPMGGTVSVSVGQVHFTPATNRCGNDEGSFSYTVSDGNGGTDTGTVTVDITCVDDAPTAVDDEVTVNEDEGGPVLVRANDVDPENDAITVTGTTQPGDGSVVIDAVSGNPIYTPDTDYCNDPPPYDTFDYTINGGDTATVRVTVTCINDAPVASDDAKTTAEDTPSTFPAGDLTGNDDDVDGDSLTVTAVSGSTGGTAVLASGDITFTPTADLCAPTPAGFDYTVSDGQGGTDTGHVTVTVTCVNDAPIAGDDSRTVDEDSGENTFSTLLGNDTDAESDPITITAASNPPNGSTTFTSSSVSYTPDADFCGADSFTYTVNGGDTATVSVTVTCLDDAPNAVNDSATVAEDAAASAIAVLGNDTDVESDPVTISSASDPANGTVALTGPVGARTGLTYAPDANYCNDPPGTTTDDFTYTVNGGDTATVSMTVTCVDDVPVAVDDSATVTLNDDATAIGVLTNDTDIDGGQKAIASATDPANGTVLLTGGSAGAHTGLTYEPDTGYCNTDPVAPADTFDYTLTPGGDTATVSVTVTCDVPPVAVDDSATLTEDDPATAVDVLANDTNPDGGPKTITSASDPANGTVVLTGPVGARDGLTYEPDDDYCNTPPPFDTFTYTVNGGDTATVSVTVTCVNDAPVAVDDSRTVAEDSGATTFGTLLGNDTDVESDPISITGASDPANGTTTFTAADVTYTPDPNFCGADSFTYTVNGGDTATVSVTVTCVPDAPTLDNSAGTTTYTEDAAPVVIDGAVTISNPDGLAITSGSVTLTDDLAGDVLDWTDNNVGDSITEGASTALQVTLTGSGTANQWEAALEAVTFATSSQNPSGADRTATYSVTTSAGSPTDTKLVDALNVDDLPTADADAATVLEDAIATAVLVLANDDDVDAGPITISSVTDPANGTTAITGGGTGLTYAPDPNYCNDPVVAPDDTFTYTLNSGGAPQTATVSMTVTCVNDAPVADDETFSGANGAIGNTSLVVDDPTDGPPSVVGPKRSVTGDILDGDTDIDGPGPLTITAGTFATNDGGTVTIEADGDFTYLPDDDTGCGDGSDFFDYTLEDSGSPEQTDTGRVTISITDCVWYVDAAAGAGGTGRSTDPFNTLTPVNGAGGGGDLDDASDYLFLYGGGAFSTGIILETGQRLFGQPQGLTVDGTALEAATGTRPNLYNSTVGATGITLANGSEVRGVNAGQAGTASSFGIRGVGVTTSTVGANVDIVGNAIGFGLQGSAGGNVSVAATISGNTGAAVSVQQRTSGTVTVSGDVTASGLNSTVEAVNNTGATINITGKLDLSGAAQTALDLRQGGTVSANNSANTITGVTGVLATAVNLDGVTVGAGGVTLNTVSTAAGGAANGIIVNNVTGTGDVTVAGGTLTTSTRGVDVNAGSGNITVGATLNPTGGRSVEVTGHTSGTVDLDGAVNEDTTGINLTGNTGSTVRFDGGITASTGSSAAFTATGGGTAVVTGAANTLTTTTGTALNVSNTTIGADGLTFRSITSNGAPNGIVLNNTGASGGLTVSGNGGACTGTGSACTGGTIQSSTGDAVSLTTTRGVQLNLMKVINNGGNGVRGAGVTNLLIRDSVVDNNGDDAATDEAGLHFTNLAGTAEITRTLVANSPEDNARIVNSSGTLSQLDVTDSTFRDTDTVSPGNNGLLIQADGGSITADVLGNSFLRNRANGVQVITNGTGSMNVEIDDSGTTQSAFDDNNIGVSIAHNSSGTFSFGVRDLTIDGLNVAPGTGGSASPININLASAATTAMVGRVTGNTLTNSNSTTGPGIRMTGNGTATLTANVENNNISQVANRGIEVIARDGSNRINATIANNSVTLNNALAADAIRVDAGSVSTDTTTICADIRGNTATTTAVGLFGIRVRQRFAGTSYILEDYAGAPTDDAAVQTFLSTTNNGATTSADHAGAGFTTTADCPNAP